MTWDGGVLGIKLLFLTDNVLENLTYPSHFTDEKAKLEANSGRQKLTRRQNSGQLNF